MTNQPGTDGDENTITIKIIRRLTPLAQIEVEPVGQWYHVYEARRLRDRRGLVSVGDDDEDEEEEDSEEEQREEVVIEDDIVYLRSLDPAEWKNQDHYAVLGVKKYRWKATEDDIKKAYRQKVLRHHPDKRRSTGEDVREDDDYFTCITKAYEILGVPQKRRAYDSVDPEFEESVPTVKENNKANFFEVFTRVFERNARWSVRRHVPALGKVDDSRQKVDRFYNFWYDFESWREFSYLDEEDKEKGQDREERRWIEKQNKAERAKRKKEEMSRLRKLVDAAYQCDPRIQRFKDEEKERKLALKRARQEAYRLKQEAEEKAEREAEEAARAAKEAEEAQEKAKQEQQKKERDIHKKALKKERRTLRTKCKEQNYYATDDSERVQLMTDVELLCDALALTKLEHLNHRLATAAQDDSKAAHLVLIEEIGELRERIEMEKSEGVAAASRGGGGAGVSGDKKGGRAWSHEDLQLLIKAVNLFPAGTNRRWEVVAEYVNQHTTTDVKNRAAKEVLQKAKNLQNSDSQMRDAANKAAFANLNKSQKTPGAVDDAKASQRLETPQEMLGINTAAWTGEEQRLLEQALKTFPSSASERWEKISGCIPNRSKKDCMKRYKELVEMVKAKKAAQAAAASDKK